MPASPRQQAIHGSRALVLAVAAAAATAATGAAGKEMQRRELPYASFASGDEGVPQAAVVRKIPVYLPDEGESMVILSGHVEAKLRPVRGSAGGAVKLVDALLSIEQPRQQTAPASRSVGDKLTPLVSGWVLVHGVGNHTNSIREPQIGHLVRTLRDTVADSVDVCRPAVTITEVRAVNVDIVETMPSVLQRSVGAILEMPMRGWTFRQKDNEEAHVNLTQLKAWFEIRVFDEMRNTQTEMAQRIDRLQVYGKFVDVGRRFVRSFQRNFVDFGPVVILDDLGYASRDVLWRSPLSRADIEECYEEALLADARSTHQYVIAASLLLVGFITCAGSAIFTIKHPTNVPSRLNPLGFQTTM